MAKSTKANRRDRKQSVRRSSPQDFNTGFVLQQVHETFSQQLSSTAGGVIGSNLTIDPVSLLNPTRFAAYRNIADEVRLDFVTLTLTPVLGVSSAGRSCLYIERDPAGVIVADPDTAADQREQVHGRVTSPLSIRWRPQEPADLEFNLLNPGTVSLGSFMIVSDSITDAAGAPFVGVCYTMVARVCMTIRGRP